MASTPDRPTADQPTVDLDPIPALMRWARGSYGDAVRLQLARAGFDDLPRNGAFVIGGMANGRGSAADMIHGLGVTKQAASQLIDTLVLRGYLTREIDSEDRRRLTISLTERGHGAADAVHTAVESIDAELATMITPTELSGLRAGLVALTEIKMRSAEHHHHHDD
jgi:DNA-binding MarR family transcriptional regulator